MSQAMESRVGRIVSEGRTDFLTRAVPAPTADEVIIQIKASALCGSDLHIFKAKHPSVPLPATIGHEFSGDIVAMGAKVTALHLGQRVTVEPCEACGTCDACRHGEYGSCDQLMFIYRRGDGAMADYITVKAASVFPLPDGMTYETGALIEPLAVATHAVRRANVRLGETVLVLGAGAIGLLVAALCKRMGAKEVIVSDFSAFRLQMAMTLGATRTVNPGKGESLEQAVAEATGGKGVDQAFECVGREETLTSAIQLLRKKGQATVVGIFEQQPASFPITRMVTHELRLQGSQGYCWDFPAALQMAGPIDLARLVTHQFPLDELQTALEVASDRTQNSVKVILKP